MVVGQARRSNASDRLRSRDRTHFSSVQGLPAVSGSTNRARSVQDCRIFFSTRGRPPPGSRTRSVGRPRRSLVEFIAADANGLGMQSRDFGNLLNAAMPAPPGFASGHPTPLLFIQAAENQIEVTMVFLFGMVASLTCRTPTFVNRTFRCHHRPPSLARPENYQIQSNRGIDVGQVLRRLRVPFGSPARKPSRAPHRWRVCGSVRQLSARAFAVRCDVGSDSAASRKCSSVTWQ